MREIINPYQPGVIPDSKKTFFGRQEIVSWLEQQIIAQRRLMILHGPHLIGKTSFIRFLPSMISLNGVIVTLSFNELTDCSINTILAYFIQQLTQQLTAKQIITPSQIVTARDAVSAVDQLLTLVEENNPDIELLLVIDDFDYCLAEDEIDITACLDVLQSLLTRHAKVHVILTITSTSLAKLHHPLLDSAPVQQIPALSPNDTLQFITRPVAKIIRFDYGVPKRIAELNSNHPYYLSLFNHVLFTRYARDGWVNLRHLDETLEDVLNMDIPSFQDIWQQSTKVEQVVLSATASVKGTHGFFTQQEIIALLSRQDKKADKTVILTALESLATRGILVKMGALSYKFYVDLFRFWLQKHIQLVDVLKEVTWRDPNARPEPPPPPIEEETTTATSQSSTLKWPIWVLALVALTLLAILLAIFVFFNNNAPQLNAGIPTTQSQENPISFATATSNPVTPTITPTPAPTKTPTPTPPVVVAKSLPSIAYMARRADAPWQIYVMGANGSDGKAISNSESDDTSPVWSPSGYEIAFVSQRDGNREIYIMDLEGNNVRNFSNHPADDWTPAWSSDGKRIAFASNRPGFWEIFIADIDGSNLQQLTNTGTGNISPVWSPDGEWLAFSSKRDGNWEIYRMRNDGTDLRRLTNNEGNDLAPIWSPDGRLIAYETNVDDIVEIFVMSASGGNHRNISNASYANDHGPVWSPDGQRLIFYSNRDGSWDLYSIALDGGGLLNLTKSPDVDEQTPVWRP